MRALGASVRVFAVVDRESVIPTDTGVPVPSSVREGIVRFENVTFAYSSRPEVKVLKNFSFEMPVGGSTAIVLVRSIALQILMLICQVAVERVEAGKAVFRVCYYVSMTLLKERSLSTAKVILGSISICSPLILR